MYGEERLERARSELKLEHPKKWKPSDEKEGQRQGQRIVHPDLFLLTSEAGRALGQTVTHARSRARVFSEIPPHAPPHNLFIGEATLDAEEWATKIFQLEKALMCLEHASLTKSLPEPETALTAIIFNGHELAYEECVKKTANFLNSRSSIFPHAESLLVRKYWEANRLIICFSPFKNIYKAINDLGEQITRQGEQITRQGEQITCQGEQITRQGEQIGRKIDCLGRTIEDMTKEMKLMKK